MQLHMRLGSLMCVWGGGGGGAGFAFTHAVRVIRVLSHFQYLQLYATHSGHMSSRFEKLVKLIGTQLTHHIYDFITYVQVGTTARSNKALWHGGK